MEIKVGDVVAIRGDKRMNFFGGKWVCAYLPEQLVDGKYVKHTGHGGVWTGIVESIDHEDDMVKVGGVWRGSELFEKFPA